jgi:hypothetical protein
MSLPGPPGGRLYLHEDVYVRPGQVANYLENIGRAWPFSDDSRFDLVGTFAPLRPCSTWPRAVNVWEMDWRRAAAMFEEQFGEQTPRQMEAWWRESLGHRTGGWDRLLRPTPGSPSLADLRGGLARPCVVQQTVRVRAGALEELLEWVDAAVAPAADAAGWQAILRLGALHGTTAMVYFAAPTWAHLLDLGPSLPLPDAGWNAVVESATMRAWKQSAYLAREV